jgi:hypothetical protein
MTLNEKYERPGTRMPGEEAEAIRSSSRRSPARNRSGRTWCRAASSRSRREGALDKIGRDIEKANAKVARKMRAVYDRAEGTEEEAERRVAEFRAAAVKDRHRALLRAIKSCTLKGDEIIPLERYSSGM